MAIWACLYLCLSYGEVKIIRGCLRIRKRSLLGFVILFCAKVLGISLDLMFIICMLRLSLIFGCIGIRLLRSIFKKGSRGLSMRRRKALSRTVKNKRHGNASWRIRLKNSRDRRPDLRKATQEPKPTKLNHLISKKWPTTAKTSSKTSKTDHYNTQISYPNA